MVMVDPKVYAARDGSAVPPVVALMEKNYSLAGIGLEALRGDDYQCDYDDEGNLIFCDIGGSRGDGGEYTPYQPPDPGGEDGGYTPPTTFHPPSVTVKSPPGAVPGTKVLKSGDSGWAQALQFLVKTYGQAYINEHQAIVMRTDKNGTTVYQATGGTSANAFPGGQAAAAGVGIALGSTAYLIMGGMALVAVLMLSRNR